MRLFMKKKRNLPYGYHIVNGKIAVCDEEAIIVKRIFKLYVDGGSLGTIAKTLTTERISYSDLTTDWNKSRLSRLLENKKYIGAEGYPNIITVEMFETAMKIKSSKRATVPSDNNDKTVQLICNLCGARLHNRNANGKQFFQCNKCGYRLNVAVNEVVDRVKIIYDYLTRNAEVLIPKKHVETASQKPDIKLYELRNKLMQTDFDQDEVLQIISDIAKIEYNASDVGSDILARRLKNRIERASCDGKVSVEFIQEYIDKVFVDKRGNIILYMTTGVQISERSVIDGSHKNPEKNGELT